MRSKEARAERGACQPGQQLRGRHPGQCRRHRRGGRRDLGRVPGGGILRLGQQRLDRKSVV